MMPTATQEARLFQHAGDEIPIKTIQVPAFPNNPDLLHLQDGTYYTPDTLGYGVSWLAYVQVQAYEVGE
jgi:hypothetical protein